ncbi:MAG: hypothetical protein RLZZ601_648 [Pseudomonadota bacterium]|jgi:hypothetical protein
MRYKFEGSNNRIASPSDHVWQSLLSKAYEVGDHPICLCNDRNPPMYLSKFSDEYVLKRMPGTGALHASHCDSYEPPIELSGLGELLGTAIIENTKLGTTTLKIGFPLRKMPGRAAPVANPDASVSSVKAEGKRLGFRSLLQYLWAEAGFNRWTPKMQGKRNWVVIRKYLNEALNVSMVKHLSLSESSFLPHRWLEETDPKFIENEMRRKERWIKASQFDSNQKELLLLIGEVKNISESRFGYSMAIKQIPHIPFYMDADVHRKLLKHFEGELTLRNAFPGGHLMVIGTFGINESLTAKFEELALMYVDENWLPVESMGDAALTSLLVKQERTFVKGMRYNLSIHKPLASAVLSDTGPKPTALYLTPSEVNQSNFINEQTELIANSDMDSWIWKLNEPLPNLPQLQGNSYSNEGAGHEH